MQTLLPYKNFISSAKVLDDETLGKQRVENMQIMTALARMQIIHYWFQPQVPHGRDPGVLMWKGHEPQLWEYQLAICREWTRRGFADSCLAKTTEVFKEFAKLPECDMFTMPMWWGKGKLHASHRAYLLHLNPDHYADYQWPEQPANEVWWPVVY